MNDALPNFPAGRVAIFNGPNIPFEFSTRNLPALKPGEILVKVLYTTICGSDIHTYCGRRMEPPQVVLGHEIVGNILWIDPDHPAVDARGAIISIGDRITWSIFSVPEGIHPPRPDMPQKSDQLFKYGHALAKDDDVFNGGLADYCILKRHTALIKISADIPIQVAATINCAQATVAGALRVAETIKDKRVMVFGAGLLGLSCVAMCREAGAKWIGIMDQDQKRLEWSRQFGADLGFDAVINNRSRSWPDVDLVFDMTGHPDVMKIGIDSLLVGGIAVWIGAVFPAEYVMIDAQQIVRKIIQIRGLHNYNFEDFLTATSFVENNYTKYPFEELVEKEFHLEDTEAAFHFAMEHRPVRVGIKVS